MKNNLGTSVLILTISGLFCKIIGAFFRLLSFWQAVGWLWRFQKWFLLVEQKGNMGKSSGIFLLEQLMLLWWVFCLGFCLYIFQKTWLWHKTHLPPNFRISFSCHFCCFQVWLHFTGEFIKATKIWRRRQSVKLLSKHASLFLEFSFRICLLKNRLSLVFLVQYLE